MNWNLTVNDVDYSAYLQPGANVRATASSPEGVANFTLAGDFNFLPNQPVVLSRNGNVLWEGQVSDVKSYDSGQTTYTMVQANHLASTLDIATQFSVTVPTDTAQIANTLVAGANIIWGGSTYHGITAGNLSVSNVASGLTTLATMSAMNWRVQNGTVIFVNDSTPVATLTTALNPNSISAEKVAVRGGIDNSTRKALYSVYPTQGSESQPAFTTYHSSYPEAAHTDTLDTIGSVLAVRYGDNSQNQLNVDLGNAHDVREGDVVTDANGVTLHLQSIQYRYEDGDWQLTADLGYPILPLTPQYDFATTAQVTQNPPVALSGDFVVYGADVTWNASEVNLTDALIVFNDQQYYFPAEQIPAPNDGEYFLLASYSPTVRYYFSPVEHQPIPHLEIPIHRINIQNSVVLGDVDVRPRGGIDNNHLAHGDYVAPTFGTATLSSQAASSGLSTDVTVTVPFTNIPQDHALRGVAWYVRTYNATTPNGWTLVAVTEPNGQPNPSASQTLKFSYAGMHNGGTYDFAVGYVSIRNGFGSIAQVSPVGGYQVQAVALSQKILNNTEWPGGTYTDDGGTNNIDGAINNIPVALYQGPTLRLQGSIKKGTATSKAGFRIGIPNLWWYEAILDGSGVWKLNRIASDNTTASLLSSQTFQTTVDTNQHFYHLTMWMDNNQHVYLEAQIDNVTLWVVDNNPNVLPNEVSSQVYTGGNSGTLYNYLFYSVNNSYALLPVVVQNTFNRTGTGSGLDNIVDGSTFKKVTGVSSGQITWASLFGDTSGNTNSALVDGNNQRWVYTTAPGAIQQAIGKDSNGNPILQLPNGTNNVSVSGNVPYGNSSLQFQAIATSTAGSDQSYLNTLAVSHRHVQSTSIIATQASYTRYDTILNNVAGGSTSTQWYNLTTSAYVGPTGTINNGNYIKYDVGSSSDPGTSSLSSASGLDTLTLPAAPSGTTPSSVTVEFVHPTFNAGNGQLYINFANVPGQTINPVVNSNTGSGQSQPFITSATYNDYYDDYSTSSVSYSQNATITPTSNNNYTNDAITSGTVSGSSTSTITGGTTYNQVTGGTTSQGIQMGNQSTTGGDPFTLSDGTTCTHPTYYNWTPVSNNNLNGHQWSVSAYSDGSHPIEFVVSFPTTFSVTTGHTSGNPGGSCRLSGPVGDQTQVCTCTSVTSTQGTATYNVIYNWVIKNSSGGVVGSNTNYSGNQTLIGYGGGQDTYTLTVTPQYSSDPGGTATPDGLSTQVSMSAYPVYYTSSTSYNSNVGSWSEMGTTDANTLAPSQYAISFNVGTVTNTSDAHGSSEVDIQLNYPNGSLAATWSNVTNGQVLTFNSSTTTGAYQWWMISRIHTNNNNGTGSYPSSINGTMTYYLNRNHPYNTYPATEPSTTSPTAIATAVNVDAPTAKTVNTASGTATCQLNLVINGYSAPNNNSYGGAALLAQLFDPSGNQLLTSYTDPNNSSIKGQLITGNGTYSYSNASAPGGNGTNGYTWKLMTVVNTNNSNAPSTQTYTVSCTAQAGWYVYNNHPYTVYTDNSGPSPAQYLTPTSTLAPVDATKQLSFTFTSVTTPSDASGSTYLISTLTDPNSAVVYDSTYDFNFITTGTSFTQHNLVPDSGVASSSNWVAGGSGLTYAAGAGPKSSNAFKYTGNGSASGYQYEASGAFSVTPGQVYTIGVYMDATNVTAGSLLYALYDTTLATQYAFVAQAAGTKGWQYKTWTCPTGVTAVKAIFDTYNATVTNAATVLWAFPMVVSGTTGMGPGQITSNNTTINYYNASAVAGSYTWTVYGQVLDKQSGTKTYTVSWANSYSEYIPGGGTGYVLSADGSTQYTAVNSSDIQMNYLSPQTVRFKVYNSAQQTIQITLGVDWKGF